MARMKKICFLLLAFISVSFSFAQVKDPVKWNFSLKKISVGVYEVHLTALLENDWHIYSQTTANGGPSATKISFVKNPLLKMEGVIKEVGKLEQHFEPLFSVDVKQYSHKVDFVQIVKLKVNAKTTIKGTVEYMTCNDRECMPPAKQTFSLALN